MSGTIYMPTASLQYSGSFKTALTMALIADNIKNTGSSTLAKDTSGALTGLGTPAKPMMVQ